MPTKCYRAAVWALFVLARPMAAAGEATSAEPARFSIEAKVGLPLTQALTFGETFNSAVNPYFGKCGECATQRTVPYVVGPAVEARLTDSYRLSVGALYSRAVYNHTSATFSASGTSILQDTKNVVNRWEFPVLLKRGFQRGRMLQPFVAAGVSTQYSRSRTTQALVGSHSLFGGTFIGTSSALTPAPPRLTAGPVAAGGIHVGRSRRGPTLEVRYTRWLRAAVMEGPFQTLPDEASPSTVRSKQNQVQLLVGFVF